MADTTIPRRWRKRPVVITASQWFKAGDHPAVRNAADKSRDWPPGALMVEGQAAGWIETLEGGHIVTPGDWIATGVAGEHYPIKPEIFAQLYDLAEDHSARSALSVGFEDDEHPPAGLVMPGDE